MMLLENIRLALTGLRANKMRALLTMLGIIIGIASVIAIMTVGDSLTVELNNEFASMGASNIEVMLTRKINEEELDDSGNYYYDPSRNRMPTDDDYMTEEMLEAYIEAFEDKIYAIAAQENCGATQVKSGNLYANIYVNGVNLGRLYADKKELLAGRFFSEKELKNGSRVCLVSDKYVNNMFDGDMRAAIGQDVYFELGSKNYTFNIVGVYEYKQDTYSFETVAEKDISTDLFIPVRTAKNINHSTNYADITVIGESGIDVDAFVTETMDFFNRYYERNKDFEIYAYSLSSYMEEINQMMGATTMAISVIAGIALLVGGIGVMNIMLVSITERTREIGTRKALGAPNSSIRIQFIVESIVICLIGGIIGMILGILMGFAGTKLIQSTAFSISPRSVILSIGFSMAIGIFFGYYPANKAAKMDPIEALRYE